MIDSILLVDDEDLFHLVFEDSCSLLDITLSLKSLNSSDEAAQLFADWQKNSNGNPECVFRQRSSWRKCCFIQLAAEKCPVNTVLAHVAPSNRGTFRQQIKHVIND